MADFILTSPQQFSLLPPSSPSPSSRAQWYIPGPSSKFNFKHERSRMQIPFLNQRSYTSIAPVLSTERRSHRRAQITANVPTLKSTPSLSLLSPTAPTRSPLSRNHSNTSASMSATAQPHFHGPVTPASQRTHSSSSRPTSKLQDSPFSDYFTDDTRSINMDSVAFSAPSPETQHLLVRLNKLQSLLMRGEDESSDERNAIGIIDKKIGELELQLSTMHSQTRMPPEMEDSGLFMEEDDDEEEDQDEGSAQDSKNETPLRIHNIHSAHQTFEAAAAALLASGEEITPENRKAENDWLLLEAQKVLENVQKANTQLRLRCTELTDLHSRHTVQTEEQEREISNLQSDITISQTELVFLKSQHKALETEVEALDNGARRLESYVPEIGEDIQKAKKARIKQEMRRWEAEWEEVERRMKERRNNHRVSSSSATQTETTATMASSEESEPADRQLDTVQEDDGKVETNTIKRTISTDEAASAGDIDDREAEEEVSQPMQDGQKRESRSPPQKNRYENYINHSTQTDPLAPIPPAWSPLFIDGEEEDEAKTADPNQEEEGGDCAITTSSEASDDDDGFSSTSDDEEANLETRAATAESPIKTALKDLWEGLASYAGMGEERF